MLSNIELHEVKTIINAQQNILSVINAIIDNIDTSFSDNLKQENDLAELDKLLSEIEQNESKLDKDDLADWDENEISNIYIQQSKTHIQEISKLNYQNWEQFTKDSLIYCVKNNIEPNLPYEAYLTDKDFETLMKEDYNQQNKWDKWDKWDYIFAGTAGILASLSDYFLVKIPQTIKYNGSFQKGSPITEFLKNHINSENDNWFSNFAKNLENKCKVPYDAVKNGLDGMYPKSHRLQTFGHDPLLGFIFGVIDIYRGTLTGFSYDHLAKTHTLTTKLITEDQSVNLIQAVLLQLGHLISDVGTKMGIQPPFFTLFQGINIESPFSPNNKTIGQIARWMYLNGYDFRHFITMGITPAIIELILRAYLMIKHYKQHGEVKFSLANNPKYRSMLLSAHAIASAGNVGKIVLMQGNPLAINYAEWLALFRYLLPSLKYWIFDKTKLELAHLEKINESGWNEILSTSDIILKKIYVNQLTPIKLGELKY